MEPGAAPPTAGEAGPGARLKAAREARGMALAQAARGLRLPVATLAALEADDQSALPGPAYVAGYLRAYARLLGLPPDDFAAAVPVTETGRLLPDILRPRHRPGHMAAGAGVAAVMALLGAGAWWLWPRPHEPSPPAPAAPAPAAPPAATPAGRPPPEPGHGSTSAPATLALDYRAASWTEVYDARGRLVYRQVEAGERLVLHGVPPFRVVLGYAPGVSITYNGALFDPSAHTRNDVARFRLGIPQAPAAH